MKPETTILDYDLNHTMRIHSSTPGSWRLVLPLLPLLLHGLLLQEQLSRHSAPYRHMAPLNDHWLTKSSLPKATHVCESSQHAQKTLKKLFVLKEAALWCTRRQLLVVEGSPHICG